MEVEASLTRRVSQVARHRTHDCWRLDHLLGDLVYYSLCVLWPVVLLRVLFMPEMLWQLLRVLRSSQGKATQVPG